MCIQYLQGYTGMCQQSWLKHGVQAINVYEVLHKMLGHLILSSHVLRSLPPLALFCKWLMATNVHFLMSGITHIQNTMCILNVDKWKGKGLCNNVWLSLMASTLKGVKKNKRYTFRTHHYTAHIAHSLKTSIKNPSKAFHSTRCVMIRAAPVTTSRTAPLALLQDNTMHTLHVRAQVVDPVEPSRTEVTLVL